MWKTLGKLLAAAIIENFVGGFMDEAGRAVAKKIFPEKEESDEDSEGETEEPEPQRPTG